jgi:CheY-like chemotaxis protein
LACADAEAIQIFSRILRELNITVECSSNWAVAQDRIEEARFDVLLLDSGEAAVLGLISVARRSRVNRAALIIAVVNNPGQAAQAFADGANFILYKPVLKAHIAETKKGAGARSLQDRRTRTRRFLKIPADISFAAHEAVPVTLLDLSEEGVSLKSAIPLPANCRVYFQFFLPAATNVIRLSGEVMWQNSGRAGIRFASVPQASQRAIKTWMEAQSPVEQITTPDPPPLADENEPLTLRLSTRLGLLLAAGNNRRTLPRYACHLGAQVCRLGEKVLQRCNVSDLNREGCYVETAEPFPVETPLKVVMRTQGFKLALEGKVRIMHPGFGMGVQFAALGDQQRDQLQHLIDNAQAQLR